MTQMGWGSIPELDLLAELTDQPDWQERALCAQTDPEAFYPEKGGSTREAKRVCLSCEVKDECLEYALAHQERFGIWGGLSEQERRKLKTTTPRPPRKRSVLTPEEEAVIITMHATGVGRQPIADKLDVSRFAVQRVIERTKQNGAAA